MRKLPNIVVLTGAGISAESGLATFRAQDGLWEGESVEAVATYQGYQRDPKRVHHFYNQLRRKLFAEQVKPNSAHYALTELQQFFGTEQVTIITQNVDNLHERAQSQNVIHMHGELLKVRDEQTGEILEWQQDIDHQATPQLRPHIVWFGEMPLKMALIDAALQQADYFIAIGTSGNVYPAAGFVAIANHAGAKTVELNLEPSLAENQFQQKIYGPATEIVPKFVQQFIAQFNN